MSSPPAPQGAPTLSPPSGGAITSSEPDSPSSSGGISSPPAPSPGNSSIVGGTPTPGCAACKHKRQKCPPGCVLLPYFPASEPDKFRNVLRVFGVKNLLRTLREVPQPRWDACVRTVVYESKMRLMDPVRGCIGAIEDLEAQLMDTAVELEVLRRRQEAYQHAKRGGLIRSFRQPNPSHGRAAPSPPGATDLGAARQQSGRTREDVMQPRGPYGTAWPPAMAGLTETRPQLPAMQPQFSAAAVQPELSEMHQFSAMQPQLSAIHPQPAMRQQPSTRGVTAMMSDGGFRKRRAG